VAASGCPSCLWPAVACLVFRPARREDWRGSVVQGLARSSAPITWLSRSLPPPGSPATEWAELRGAGGRRRQIEECVLLPRRSRGRPDDGRSLWASAVLLDALLGLDLHLLDLERQWRDDAKGARWAEFLIKHSALWDLAVGRALLSRWARVRDQLPSLRVWLLLDRVQSPVPDGSPPTDELLTRCRERRSRFRRAAWLAAKKTASPNADAAQQRFVVRVAERLDRSDTSMPGIRSGSKCPSDDCSDDRH